MSFRLKNGRGLWKGQPEIVLLATVTKEIRNTSPNCVVQLLQIF